MVQNTKLGSRVVCCWPARVTGAEVARTRLVTACLSDVVINTRHLSRQGRHDGRELLGVGQTKGCVWGTRVRT